MASPSDPTDSCQDPVAETDTLSPNPILTQKSNVEEGSVTAENENSVASNALNLDESDARDQLPEASIEESKNEEDDMDVTPAVSSSVYRRGGGRKRKKLNLKKLKQQEKSKEKLEILLKTLKPIPFVPGKTLDFSQHEKLLKTLGIWEFLHLEFDQSIRQDLVANLVAYYSPEGRCSYVNGVRIKVSRADLARGLKLPKKKDIVFTEEEREILEKDESARFVDEILETWVLLQSDDMWIMPVEVYEWRRDVKQKQLEKLDWAALIWFMVEKELKADPPLGDCFFASHLQLLIKSQKEDLLKVDDDDDGDVKEVDLLLKSLKEDCLEVKEEDVVAADSGRNDCATDSKEEENCLEVKKEDCVAANSGRDDCAKDSKEEENCLEVKEEDVVAADSGRNDCVIDSREEENHVDDDVVKEVDLMVKSLKEDCLEVKEEDVGAADSGRDDCAIDSKEEENYVEEHMIELNLGQETVSEIVHEEEQGLVEGQPMDVEENKKQENEKWSWNEDTHAGSHFLRRCDLSSAREGDEENNIGSMEMGEDEPIEDFEEEEAEEDKEKHEGGFHFFPNGDTLHGVGQENLMLEDASPVRYVSGLQIHGNPTGGQFLASRVDMHMAMGSGSSSLFVNANDKRQIEHENDIAYHPHNPSSKRLRSEEPSWDEKPPPVEMCIDQIEGWIAKARMSYREREQSVMDQEFLMNELRTRDEMIQDLERTKYEEQQRTDLTICRLENELRMMTSVLEGYRHALKETKKASNEHRKRCPLRDEKPVYKDVKGSGGLVLSINEIKKLRLKQEAEDKMTRARIERQIEVFGSECLKVFQGHMDAVELLNERLLDVEYEVNICRETLSVRKDHETSEVAVAAATEETGDALQVSANQ